MSVCVGEEEHTQVETGSRSQKVAQDLLFTLPLTLSLFQMCASVLYCVYLHASHSNNMIYCFAAALLSVGSLVVVRSETTQDCSR